MTEFRARKNIIIVAPADDIHALVVQQRIQEIYGNEVSSTIFDTATLPVNSTISWFSSSESSTSELSSAEPLALIVGTTAGTFLNNRSSEPTIILSDSIEAIWLRRQRKIVAHPEIELQEHRDFASRSANILLRSFFESNNTYNPYSAEAKANQKPYQLWLAQRVGLAIPRTLITSDPGKVTEFFISLARDGRECLYKRIGTSRGFDYPSRLLEHQDLERLSTVRYAPLIFQERITGGSNVRVAIVGRNVFSAEWSSREQESEPVDIRGQESAKLGPTDIPEDIKTQLLRLHKKFGLVFGIYDLKYDQSGELYFLEVNPSGQWLAMELEAGFPISETWARVLVEGIGASISCAASPISMEFVNQVYADTSSGEIEWTKYV
jgi:glutathione synthase/RimK-type ligase-like ATP-grasp enzyme